MAPKRKHSTKDSSTQRKKAKTSNSLAQHPHGEVDPDQEYEARAILDESKNKYLIQWEDNTVTGEKFNDSWEPKRLANKFLVRDWNETKRQRSASAQSAAQANTTPKRIGRPRKTVTIVSSPPPPEQSPQVSGREAEAEGAQDDDLEIEESQPTVVGADEGSDADSPLFVPLDSPKSRKARAPNQPSVQISDPPSSYAAGAYQNISSSQIPESAAPRRRKTHSPDRQSSQAQPEFQQQAFADPSSPLRPSTQAHEETARRKSPEASQWQPEEGDTSKTTEDTTEVSLGPTSSEPTRSAPVNFERRANNVVPDSQSLPDSSSFVPSANQTQSSSAPELRGRGRPLKEVTQSASLPQSPQTTQSSWQGLSSQPAAASQRQTQSGPGASQQSVPAAAPGKHQIVAFSSQVSPPSHTSPAAPVQALPSQSQLSAAEEILEGGGRAQSEFASPTSTFPRPQSQTLPAALAAETSRSLSGAAVPNSDKQDHSASAAPFQPRDQSATSSQAQSQASRQIQQDDTQPSKRSSVPSAQVGGGSQSSGTNVRETTERPESKSIDLTKDTQPPAGQTSSIAVTPLPPRHLIAAQRKRNSTLPGSSWESPSFPFQTQFFRPFSSTRGSSLPTQHIASQDVRAAQSQGKTTSSLGPAFEPSTAPAAFSSQIRTSSPIPSGPKHSLRTFEFGESAPPRPQTPSSPGQRSSRTSSMEPSPNEFGLTGLAKTKAMRARKRAELDATLSARRAARAASQASASAAPSVTESSPPKSSIPPHVTADTPTLPNPARLASPLLIAQDGARSPSVVPAMEALPEITTEEMNTSERYPTLIPQASVAEEEGEKQRNSSLTGRATPVQQQPAVQAEDPETASVHTIPITLVGHQRDQYPQMVYYHQELIRKFLELREPGDQVIQKIRTFVERMRFITLHPDLDNIETTFTQYDVEPAQQATWDVSCSAKFRFLKTLLDGLMDEEKHIVIAVQSGRLAGILSTFLQGIDIQSSSAAAPASSSSGSSKLKVSIITEDTDRTDMEKADLVLGLDNSFRHTDAAIRSLRQQAGEWIPFASLVVPRSIEHVECHLSSSLSDRARLRALVSGIDQLKSEAGRQEEGQLSPTDSANALAAYLKDGAEDRTWPLVGLSSLQDLDSQTESEIEPPESMASPAVGMKRQRVGSEGPSNEDELNKRVRTEPSADPDMPTTVNLQDVELTHVSDSIEKLTQANAEGDPVMTDTERRLQRLLQSAQNRIEELTADMSGLQYRHEEARTVQIRTESERDQATSMANGAILRSTDALNRESVLRSERTELKKELNEANLRLLDHTVPERAEHESLRQALAQAKAEKATIEKRLEQARNQCDFFRDQYQEASNTAQREVSANAELRNQVAHLTNRATGEQTKLRQMGYDARTKQLENENKKLKAMLKDHKAGLKFRDDEIAKLKEASRGRMGTRGTSVPRSPRLASPMGGGRSRQGSPATGEIKGRGSLLHPLRNNA